MNVFISSVVLLVLVRASAVQVLRQIRDFDSLENEPESVSNEVEVGDSNTNSVAMNATAYMTVNHYYCAAEDIEDTLLILYGTKSWTFPRQDVNLTLSYPTASEPQNLPDEGYIITGFKVFLYVDSKKTKGYIIQGGVLQESISLSFVSNHISSLSYEFWLYGQPKHTFGSYKNIRYFECT